MKRLRLLSGSSLIDRLSLGVVQASQVIIVIMVTLITVEVFSRKFFGISLKVAQEFSGYLLVGLVFWGLAEALKMGKHLRVTVLTSHFNQKVQSVLYKASLVIALAFILLLLWAATGLVVDSYGNEAMTESVIPIPEFIPELFIPIGLFFFVLQLGVEIFREFMRRG